MFDPVSLGIMGGGMALSSAFNVAGGLISQDGARDAQAAQLGQLDLARASNDFTNQQLQALYSPYQLYGSSALSFLQDRIMNSTERKMADIQQRTALESEIQRLSQVTDWASFPNLVGEKASERKASMFQQMEQQRKTALAAAQNKLASFDREQTALAPYRAEQEAYLKNKQSRIDTALNRLTSVSNFSIPTSLQGLRADMENDPVFQFRKAEGEREINRAAASRGQYFSGAAIGTLADFNMKLTGDETDRYLQRLIMGKQAEMGAASTALQAELGASQQDINNMFGLANFGMQANQGIANVGMNANQVNASLHQQAGQAAAQTEMAKSNAVAGIFGTTGQSVGAATGLLTMANMFSGGAGQKPVPPGTIPYR